MWMWKHAPSAPVQHEVTTLRSNGIAAMAWDAVFTRDNRMPGARTCDGGKHLPRLGGAGRPLVKEAVAHR